MFKTLALLPAIFAGANAIKAQYHATTDPVEAASEPDPEIAARFQDPVVDKDDMLWRLDYTQTVFEAYNSFVDTIALFDNDAEGWGWYVNQNAGWYIEEINWCTESLTDGFKKGFATQDEVWAVLNEEDIESTFRLFSSLGGTEANMKSFFDQAGRDPDEVDYLQYMTGYSIDGDKYYGQEGDYVSYDDFESMYAVGGSTDDVFSYEYWAMGEIEDDPYATIDPELYAIWDDIENSSTPEEELIWEVWDLYYEYWEEGDPEIWELKCDALPEELSWMTQEDCQVIYDHFNDNSEDVEDMQGDQDYSKEDAWFAFDAFNDYYDNVWEDGYPEIWDLDCDEVVAETEQYSYDQCKLVVGFYNSDAYWEGEYDDWEIEYWTEKDMDAYTALAQQKKQPPPPPPPSSPDKELSDALSAMQLNMMLLAPKFPKEQSAPPQKSSKSKPPTQKT